MGQAAGSPFFTNIGPASATSGGILTASGNQAIGGNKQPSGDWTFSGNTTFTGTVTGTGTKLWDNSGTIRATGAANPTTGVGTEILYSGGVGYLQAFDRAASYMPLNLRASTVTLSPSGAASFTATTTKNTHAVPEVLKSYLVSTAPAASVGAGAQVYMSDAAGSPCVAFSNGSVWKRCDNAATTVT